MLMDAGAVRAGDDRQPCPTHKDHRLSDRSVSRSLPPCHRRHDCAGWAGRWPTQPVNAEPPPPLPLPHGRLHAAPFASYRCRLSSHGSRLISRRPSPADDVDCWLIDG